MEPLLAVEAGAAAGGLNWGRYWRSPPTFPLDRTDPTDYSSPSVITSDISISKLSASQVSKPTDL
jgi:hypothetical protein